MKIKIGLLATALAAATGSSAQAVTLYDGSAGTTPQSQGWLSYFALLGAAPTTAGGKTILDTTSINTEHAGYSNYTVLGTAVNTAFPDLNPPNGFTLGFNVKLDSETHASNDRAGFSVILLGDNQKGIELGFWNNEIWPQTAPTFTHGTGVAFDPVTAAHQYALTIQGSTFTLTADGNSILTGPTQDYSSFGAPYNIPSYLYIGDDTGSARGSSEISQIAITVPEPASLTALFAIGALTVRHRRRAYA